MLDHWHSTTEGMEEGEEGGRGRGGGKPVIVHVN